MSVPETFTKAMGFIFKWETERYTNDPKDPGGPTKYGITLKTLSTFRGKSCSALDVKNLKKDEAYEIYKKNYWDAVGGDSLPDPIAYAMFDSAVNCGVSRANKWLRELNEEIKKNELGIDPVKYSDVTLAFLILGKRIAYYKSLSLNLQTRFLKGWLNRVNDLKKVLSMEYK